MCYVQPESPELYLTQDLLQKQMIWHLAFSLRCANNGKEKIRENSHDWRDVAMLLNPVQTLFFVSLFHYSFFIFSPAIIIKPNLVSLYGTSKRSVVIHHCPRLIAKKTTPSLWKNEKEEKYLSCSMHYSQKLASFEFSKAQIVVNDSKLPQGFEISPVWGSFSFSNMSNGFISEGPVTMQSALRTNGWVISILNKIIANLFSSSEGERRLTKRGKSKQGQRRDGSGHRGSIPLIKIGVAETC